MNSPLQTDWLRLPDAESLRDRQLKRLRHFLKTRLIPFSPFYRRNFADQGIDAGDIRKWHDFVRLPLTSKADLIASPRDFVLQPNENALRRQPGTLWAAATHGPRAVKAALEHEFRPLLLTSTTGRSSQTVPFLMTGHDLDNMLFTGRRIMEIGGSGATYRHLNLFPYAPHLAFWQTHYAGLGIGALMVGTGGGKVLGTDATLGFVDKLQPEVLIGMPTFLYHVLQSATAERRHWPHVRKLVMGGEKIAPGLRRKLRAMAANLGAPDVEILATYGFTEAKMAWPECPAPAGGEPSGYHISPELALIEIIDPDTAEPLGEMQPGEIVFTALDSRGTCVLRYRTGDRIDGGLTHAPCLYCGRRMPRLVGSISRASEIRKLETVKLKGTLVDFNTLEHTLDDLDGIGGWQIELRKHNDDPFECDEIVVHAATDREARRDELERTISRRFFESSEVRPNRIEWHTPEEIRTLQGVGRLLKEEKVVDHRSQKNGGSTPLASTSGAAPPAR